MSKSIMSNLLRGLLIFGLLVMAIFVLIIVVIAVSWMFYTDPRMEELEGTIPSFRVDSVVKDARGEVVILCVGPTNWWVPASDAVSHILNREVGYRVKAPNHSNQYFVIVEQPDPTVPARLTVTVGDTNLLDTLPPCNVADFTQRYIPRE